eukprot:CAMPEP_0172434164 /NCGR_PEP_ID=MMETSP1064-20121228/70482_1 /TAXON_ID=202472 /ORGANISM="Aulacoseira subarctica , Strain CCAP 1002/5" /LENGTH=235 /DNA_ID=CAMNT_0013182363 /DNA_START=116 /DNA_END=819 /DNA_ORIENTATION=+
MKLEINLVFFVLGSVNHVFFRGDALSLSSPRTLFRRVFKGKPEAPSKPPPLPDPTPARVFINTDEGTHYAETHKDIDNVLNANKAYVNSMKAQDPLFFDKLGAVHKPRFLWIGCADALIEQCINLYKTGSVQRRFKDETSPTLSIHACVFDPKDGILQPLDVDFNKYLNQYYSVYDLYSVYKDNPIPKTQKNLGNVLLKNKEYVNSKKEQDPQFFDKLGAVHKPRFLWIGCADAR